MEQGPPIVHTFVEGQILREWKGRKTKLLKTISTILNLEGRAEVTEC